MKIIISKQIKIFYILLFVIMVAVLYIFYSNSLKIKTSSDLVEHTQEVIHFSDLVLLDILNLETGLRGYMLTNNKIFLDPYYKADTSILKNLASLKELTRDNHAQQLRVVTLKNVAIERLTFIKNIIDYMSKTTLIKENTIEILYSGKMLTDKMRTTVASINSEEFVLLGQRKLANEESNRSSKIIYISLLIFINVVFALIVIFARNQQRKYKNLEELTESSQYARGLIEASLDPLITINAHGKITDVNEAAIKITGISREEVTGTDFFSYFTETDQAREIYQQVIENGSVIDSPLTIANVNGTLTDVLLNGSVYADAKGNVLGVVVVARDITEQKRIKDELIKAKGKAEQATLKAEESNKLKEAFLANMSHEIRTPMNAIIGFSDILSKRTLGNEEKDYVSTIKTAGENLLTIINDILDISKIEAGMMTFEDHNFSITEIFSSLHVMLSQKATEKGLELIFKCDDDVPDILVGDNTRLTQIIINLVGNAIKFTQSGKVEVRAKAIKIGSFGERNTIVEFSIKDSGIGISHEKLDHIFERFRQAETHTTRKYGGTGLGLSIAKQLAELQGGTLTVKSTLGTGSVFSFSIPYEKTNESRSETILVEKKYNSEELSKLNVLLIEDNKLNVKLVLTLFSEHGINVQVAWNGREGVDKLQTDNFDIILLDMEMPIMNGYEAAGYIRKELKNPIPIIAMTAHAMAGERERCLGLGMNDYISKPLNANLLFEKIAHLTRVVTKPTINESKEVDTDKVCNFQYVTEIMGGKKKLILEMMEEFLKQIPEELRFINSAVMKTDYAVIKNIAHTMKSSVSIMSISLLIPILAELEDLGAKAVDINRITQLNLELNLICKRAVIEIEQAKLNYI